MSYHTIIMSLKTKCRKLLKSKKTKKILEQSWKKYMDDQIKYGGLEKNAWKKYKSDFEKGFMKGCAN